MNILVIKWLRHIICLPVFILFLSITGFGQIKNTLINGMYLQWGYNTECYTKSNIHVKDVVNGVPHRFTIYNAKAHDRNDLDGIIKNPVELTVPQYSYRVGFYLNKAHTTVIEINFDHTKYIVSDNQRLHVKGYIGAAHFDTDTTFTHDQFHFEHTNGGNFYHINYVKQYNLKKVNSRPVFTALWKAGAGIVIPKTDITLSGKRVDNKFHVAGYCVSVEGGGRWYFSKKFFLEGMGKTGFVNYTNSLAAGKGKVNHYFGYLELIVLAGYDISF